MLSWVSYKNMYRIMYLMSRVSLINLPNFIRKKPINSSILPHFSRCCLSFKDFTISIKNLNLGPQVA